MLTGTELGAAIESARTKKKISKKALAEVFEVKPPSVQGWVKNGRIDKPKLIKLIRYFSDVVELSHWGLTEADADIVGRNDAIRAPENDGNVIAADFSRQRPKLGFIEIPHLDISASMGHGASQPDSVDVIQRMTVSTDFLRQTVNFSNPEKLALITGYGDSMEGTFNDGDLLLVDRGVSEIKIDAVYVLALSDELYIKRLQRRPDGTFLMISDNRKYDPIHISETELQRFQVLGRVLLAWNARKL